VSYRIEGVVASSAPDFAEAYAALAAEFESRGELERREVIAHWLDKPQARMGTASSGDGLERSYHLLVARDDEGRLAGVRDCHVILDRSGVAVVYLAHALVLPAYRRTGLGVLLRRAPIAIGRRAIGEAGLSTADVELLLAAEMEPASLEDDASIVRLTAYGRDGFAAIAPSALPYCQPDFRDLDALGASGEKPRPIPLLAVVRFIGHDGARSLSTRLARAFVTHLYAVFATHVRPDHLAALQAATLRVLDASTEGEVPLLPLPRTTDDRATLSVLSHAAVLRSLPPELR
jgi:GNAT superfamily N-acetyltransferase